MEISSFQSYLIILFVVLIIISIFVFRQFLKTRSEEFNLVKFEQKGLDSLTQATELYEFGSIQIKKRKDLEKRNNYNPYKGIKDKGF